MAEFRYTTGGTVQAQEGGLYLVRPADQQLLELCRQSRFAYVLTPRQLGKSSLMIRTAEELLAEGFRAVMVDLTQIGTGSDAEKWYGDVLEVVADQLELTTNARAWWKQEAETGLTLRLTRFFEEVVLAEVGEPIVFFVDEIDTTLSLAFTDDFFAAIRYLYVARAQNPQLRRLSFVLIGVATPADLICDPRRTPFNIGERVDLRDFTPAEAKPLAQGLPLPPPEAQRALGWILGWTGGHPYLSQRLCSVLAETPPREWSEAAVDQAVGRTFFGERSKQDNNLQFVRDMLTKRAPEGYGAELLRTYRTIWQGKQPVADEEQNLVHAHLKLTGLVRRDGRQLVVRNRIYQSVFNAAWIGEHNPEDFWKRYGPVLMWAVPVSVSAVLVAGVMTTLALEARRQAEIATLREQLARSVNLLSTTEAAYGMVLSIDSWLRSKSFPHLQVVSASALLEALRNSREINRFIARGDVRVVAFRPDGKVIASGGSDGASLWETTTGKKIAHQTPFTLDYINTLTFSPDGRFLVSSGSDGVLKWDTASGKIIRFPFSHYIGKSVAISPDGNVVASVGSDSAIKLFDIRGGRPLGALLRVHEADIITLTFSRDSQLLASGSRDGKLRLWSINGMNSIDLPINTGGNPVNSLAFDSSGSLLASGGQGVQLWFLTGKPFKRLQSTLNNPIYSLAFNHDGSLIVSGGQDQKLELQNVWPGKMVDLLFKGHEARINSVTFSPDGSIIASASDDDTVRLWETENHFPRTLSNGGFSALAFSSTDNTLATANNQKIYFWDPRTGALKRSSTEIHKGNIISLAFSPNGLLLASGGVDGSVKLWNVRDASFIKSLITGSESSQIHSLAFSQDGRLLAISSGLSLRVWDFKESRLLNPLDTNPGLIAESPAFGRDKYTLISAGSRGMQFWDTRNGKTIVVPMAGVEDVQAFALSPDDRFIAIGGDNWIHLLDSRTGMPVRSPLKGHEGSIKSIAFSPDGLLIASSSEDNTLRLWDVNSGAAIGSPFMLDFTASSGDIAFSTDGKLAVGGWDGLYLMAASPQDWFRWACARMAHHPLLRDPASISSNQEVVKVGKRVRQACQAASPSTSQPNHQGPLRLLSELQTWAWRMLRG